METNLKLYMVLLGCTPKGRLTEQHDIFFGIGRSIEELIPDMYTFWADGGRLHIDAWREITQVDNYTINITAKTTEAKNEKLFFINMGGYKPNDFEEYHYKKLVIAQTMGEAVKKVKTSTFYKHYGFKGAVSHIDDKYALDADDLHHVQDILLPHLQELYTIKITPTTAIIEDELHIGYLKLSDNPNK
ncbi:DUF1543 domain-containing protein [Flavobacterium arcticum]|uniref:DUF1543 domain-containing protein n=1 Tax=Flavobacterium arcticum TaxID=1784713 RepID=A0A345HET2_9FLAO|nr:DUF1543 domain-containing protein [Flavobacterium arcticum]AXG75092.1 DUF1543 domain-containing protein [Flavobacterium arcticum]KAF2511129.1 DUF1543 domain-containing protein [Flavobacterium arcticum]